MAHYSYEHTKILNRHFFENSSLCVEYRTRTKNKTGRQKVVLEHIDHQRGLATTSRSAADHTQSPCFAQESPYSCTCIKSTNTEDKMSERKTPTECQRVLGRNLRATPTVTEHKLPAEGQVVTKPYMRDGEGHCINIGNRSNREKYRERTT